MSEEIQHASVAVPQALLYSICINGTLGFAIILGTLFSISDIEAALSAQQTLYYPYLEIFHQAVKSTAGACIMASLIVVLGTFAAVGTFAASSRMLWSFCRDRGTLFWKLLSKVRTDETLPASLTPLNSSTGKHLNIGTNLHGRDNDDCFDTYLFNRSRIVRGPERYHIFKRRWSIFAISSFL